MNKLSFGAFAIGTLLSMACNHENDRPPENGSANVDETSYGSGITTAGTSGVDHTNGDGFGNAGTSNNGTSPPGSGSDSMNPSPSPGPGSGTTGAPGTGNGTTGSAPGTPGSGTTGGGAR